MAEPLKNAYNKKFVEELCSEISKNYKPFESKKFTRAIFDKEWPNKELKARMRHITFCLHQFLPQNYGSALEVLKPVSEKFSGFEAMFFPDFVEMFGLKDYKLSISAMEHFTKYSSSEFAVRPFIMKHPKKMMSQMKKWADSKNYHVRRLASEGCRPRLPWAMALPDFKKDPREILEILEKLKEDESLYVRKSVANNLNDISKDNPKILITIAKKWLGSHEKTDWIVKHACRTLLKRGDPVVMKFFGFSEPKHVQVKKIVLQKNVKLGTELKFSFELHSKKKRLGKIRIEYAIDFMRSNGSQSRKVFKISEVDCDEQIKEIDKKHSFKKISTRKYYKGIHGLTVIVNGKGLIHKTFTLI